MKTGYRTARLCHQTNGLAVNDVGCLGTYLGRMDKRGTKAAHVHVDIGVGWHKQQSLTMLNNGIIVPDKDLVYRFAESDELFKTKPLITTQYLEQEYYDMYGIWHPAIDVVPEDRHITTEHYDIWWPFDCEFKVVAQGTYWSGVSYMIIWFEVEEDTMSKKLDLEFDWQWNMLENTIRQLIAKNLVSDTWLPKVKNRQITTQELVWFNTIMIGRLHNE